MSNSLHERLKTRISEMGLTYEGAAKRSGLDRSYFKTMFDRENSSPRGDTLRKIAKGLEVSEAWILTGVAQEEPTPDNQQNGSSPADAKPMNSTVAAPILPQRHEMPNNIPVMGTAAGSHIGGAFQFEGGVIDYVRRPPALMGARDIYALFVEGSSMEPQFFPGDLIYINPHKPPRIGDAIVVQTRISSDRPMEATIGILIKRTETHIVIRKHNPTAEVQLLRNGETMVHKILTMNELFGV